MDSIAPSRPGPTVWTNATRTRCISLAAVVAYDYLSHAEICRIRDERIAEGSSTATGWGLDAQLGSKLHLHLTGSELTLRGAEADEVYQQLTS